ncbi:MAG: DNA-formamidopyrimidine glycosylase family protein [Aquihabitans sp.]
MPEGHTIHRLAKDQGKDLMGREVAAMSAQPRFTEGAARLDGQLIERVEAWGKHLFHTFDTGDVLHVHLGLIGWWTRRAPDLDDGAFEEPTPTTRLRLTGEGVAWDLTGPMVCRVIDPDEQASVVAKLGPDPLRRNTDPEPVWSRLQRSAKAVGILLMEQDVVAGIGNVYRSEILNIVGIDPRRPGRNVTRSEFDALWAETVRQLRLGVRRNKIVTMSTEELPGPISKLARGEGRYVYKQEECGRCHTPLDIYPLAGRTTWSCPTCQPG